MNTNILIYDKTGVFINLIINYLGENIGLLFCNNKRKLKKIDLNTISTAYLYTDKKEDLNDILIMNNNINEVYIITNSIILKNKLIQIDPNHFLDLDTDTFKIMESIFYKTLD